MAYTRLLNAQQLASAQKDLAALTPAYSKSRAENAVKNLYGLLREKEPEIIWLPSPTACAQELDLQNPPVLHKKLLKSFTPRHFRQELRAVVMRSLRADLRIRESLWWWRNSQGRTQLSEVLQKRQRIRSLHYAVAFVATQMVVDNYGELPKPVNLKKLAAWKELYISSHFSFLRKGIVALSEPPKITLDAEGRIHHEKKPAIRYPDGEGLWAWHGVVVPQWVVKTAPKNISIHRIDAERNAEVRRVLLERYGMEKYLSKKNAHLVNKGRLGSLFRVWYQDGTWAQFIRVTNSTPEKDGSHKEYVLQVRPNEAKADDAVAWTFGFKSGKEYRRALQQET